METDSFKLWADYIEEREGKRIVIAPDGFALYKIFEKEKQIYLIDLYVAKDARGEGTAQALGDIVSGIGREKGCERLIGSVSVDDKELPRNSTYLIKYGMKYIGMNEAKTLLLFSKEVTRG